jgi:uncharacterized glyoxalase superfamily protein PhnB
MTHEHPEHEHGHVHEHEVGPRHFFGVVPVLLVDDVLATVEYYRDALGFEADFLYDNPPSYASVSRDDAIINFALSVPPGRRNGVGQAGPGNGTDLYVVVGDINDVFEEFKLTNVTVLTEPLNTDYGMREFKIEDVNGYQLIFGEEIEEA